MGRDGGEEGLAGALPDGGARVHAQVAQAPEQPQPQGVERRQVLGPVLVLGPPGPVLVLGRQLRAQVLLDALAVLEEVVGDVPLENTGRCRLFVCFIA